MFGSKPGASLDKIIKNLQNKVDAQSKKMAVLEKKLLLLNINEKQEKKKESESDVYWKKGWFIYFEQNMIFFQKLALFYSVLFKINIKLYDKI